MANKEPKFRTARKVSPSEETKALFLGIKFLLLHFEVGAEEERAGLPEGLDNSGHLVIPSRGVGSEGEVQFEGVGHRRVKDDPSEALSLVPAVVVHVQDAAPHATRFGVGEPQDLRSDLIDETRRHDDLTAAEGIGPTRDLLRELLNQTEPRRCLSLGFEHFEIIS